MGTSSNTRLRGVVLLLLVAMLGLVACGDDDGSEVASDTTTTTEPGAPDDGGDDAADGGDADGDADADETAGGELPDACTLIEDSEVEALIGPATREADEGVAIDMVRFTECVWEGEDRALVGVAITNSPNRYELHSGGFMDGEPVDGLADGAFMAFGVSLETKGATGGRTVSMLVGDHTLVVAVKIPGETPPQTILPLAETVLSRID